MLGDVNLTVNAPYIVCTQHTKEAWQAYIGQQPGFQNPTTPTEGGNSDVDVPENPDDDASGGEEPED